jgi:hypothetical protein
VKFVARRKQARRKIIALVALPKVKWVPKIRKSEKLGTSMISKSQEETEVSGRLEERGLEAGMGRRTG